MEAWIQSLLDSTTAPMLVALLLGLLTAISPCPLATNIAAVSYIGKDVADRRRVFAKGLMYTLGRTVSYTMLGVVLILILHRGLNVFHLQKFFSGTGEKVIGPLLIVFGIFMLSADKISFSGTKGNGNREEKLARGGLWGSFLLGVLFALAFCPTSAVFYFGMLIPMSATSSSGVLYPVVFAIATALPVLIVAWLIAFSIGKVGDFYGKMKTVQKWVSWIAGGIFIAVGVYYCLLLFV
ncbi:MAG: aromatic aminobenezylarsenical efflux permease ArsG family transporter [Candidatus Cryptobacteroides sp.]